MRPRSINIFLLDGDPSGVRVAQISMSTIQAIAFRRNQLRRVRNELPEIEQPGVYTLIGADEDDPDRQLAYIGESEGVARRLSYHNSAETDAKSFWTDTVVLISKDESLTKSHARYVESCLIRGVGGNPRWSITNSVGPATDAGKLPRPDRAAMDEFVDQTKTLVGALGWDLFREMRGRPQESSLSITKTPPNNVSDSPVFSLSGKNVAASMRVALSGDIVVQSGSKARARTTSSLQRHVVALRKTLLDKGVLRQEGDSLILTSDYSFSSPTAAASVMRGASSNGRSSWKLPDGRTYGEWESSQDIADTPPSQAFD